MRVIGHADRLEGSHVTGWAYIEGSKNSCAIEVRSEDGTVIGSGRACHERPDLNQLGLGRTDFAFKVRMDSTPGPQMISIYANGLELPNSPMRLDETIVDGFIHAHGATVSGWVQRRGVICETIELELRDGAGELIGRPVAASDGLSASSQFQMQLPDRVFGRDEFIVSAFVEGRKFSEVSLLLPLAGNIDQLARDRVTGWLLCPNEQQRSLKLEVWLNGEMVAVGACSILRHDLRQHFSECGAAGFDISFENLGTSVTQVDCVEIRLAGGKAVLSTPIFLGQKHAMIAAARQVASLAHDWSGTPIQRAIIQQSIFETIEKFRAIEGYQKLPASICKTLSASGKRTRLTVLIPIYKGVEITRQCIESVLREIDPHTDRLVLVNDQSPNAEMYPLMDTYSSLEHVSVLTNDDNLGFIGSVNRGLRFIEDGDVILLNSDTVMFSGAIDELWRVAHKEASIGTATAISNNATIYSYPSPARPVEALEDISWEEVARLALENNRGKIIDMPTGHGFCMFVKRSMLDIVPQLDLRFGKGYGEENAMCLRGQDLGFRDVAAPSVFVLHQESVSFGHEQRMKQLATNLPLLESMYPEYTGTIMEYQRVDSLRSARWTIDRERLALASARASAGYIISVEHSLGGGTQKAADELLDLLDAEPARRIRIELDAKGIRLSATQPFIDSFFAPSEFEELLNVLSGVAVEKVIVHAFLGLTYQGVNALSKLMREHDSLLYLHDFYAICPRVTMIDALGTFCDLPDETTCLRCLKLGGAHEGAFSIGKNELKNLSEVSHRSRMEVLLKAAKSIIAPSKNTAHYINRVFPSYAVKSIPHYEPKLKPPAHVRTVDSRAYDNVVILGAIGPHKGSSNLLDLARRAFIKAPHLTFHVIGYTNIDDSLISLDNVKLHGKYNEQDLEYIVSHTNSGCALFLQQWPETYSYTLSEVVNLGLYPLLPRLGAPADRVMESGFGTVFPFPFSADDVLNALHEIRINSVLESAKPSAFAEQRAASSVVMDITCHSSGVSTGD